MRTSAGIAIILDNKVLLVHATNSPWVASYSPPKGMLENDEGILEAAIRETYEEIGIDLSKCEKDRFLGSYTVDYKNSKNKIYKRVYIFIFKARNLKELNLHSYIIPKQQLQLKEVDDARFFTKEQLKEYSFHRFTELLNTMLD